MLEGSPESLSWMRVIFSFVTLAGLLALFGFVMKFASQKGWLSPYPASANKRLKLVESLALDSTNRLVIVQIDGHEQVLLLGTKGHLLIPSHSSVEAP